MKIIWILFYCIHSIWFFSHRILAMDTQYELWRKESKTRHYCTNTSIFVHWTNDIRSSAFENVFFFDWIHCSIWKRLNCEILCILHWTAVQSLVLRLFLAHKVFVKYGPEMHWMLAYRIFDFYVPIQRKWITIIFEIIEISTKLDF